MTEGNLIRSLIRTPVAALLAATAVGATATPPSATWRVFSATFEPREAPAADRADSGFSAGRRGRALRVGGSANSEISAELALRGVVDLSRPGAITLWMKPLDWNTPNANSHYLPLLRVTGQGPAVLVVERDRRYVGRKTDVWIAGFFSLSTRGEIQYQHDIQTFWVGDSWHFVAFQWDATGFVLQLDDGPAARTALPDAGLMRDFPKDSSTLLVGSAGPEGFLIDDLAVWSRPLTSSEIDALRGD